MFTDLSPYPDYRDSDAQWLGSIPNHWEAPRLKSAVWNINALAVDHPAGEIYIGLEHVTGWSGRIRKDSSATFDGLAKTFEPGDVLFGKLRPYLAKVTVPSEPGLCSSEFFVIRPKTVTVSAIYLSLLLRSEPAIAAVSGATFGARMPRADWGYVGSMRFALPTVDEQAAIVKYLGHANARIDRAIAAKRRLIVLLEEQKQATIAQTVARGLDATVPLKDSGIPWLGQIPVHWNVSRGKRLFHETDKRTSTGGEILFSLRMRLGLVPHNDVASTAIPSDSLIGYKIVLPGQVVMNRMRASTGLFGLAEAEGLVSPDYATLQPTSNAYASYYIRLFKTPGAMAEFRKHSTGLGTGEAGFMRLYSEDFGRLHLPAPPFPEQREIAEYLDWQTVASDLAISRAGREIELLREFRTRLVADVVTGQLDVGEAAARLPELDTTELVGSVVGQDDDDPDPEADELFQEVDA